MAGAMILAALSSCNTTTSSPATTSAPAGTTTTSAAATPTSSAVNANLSGTINVNMSTGTGLTQAWQAVADGYMKLHPLVKVNVDLKPAANYQDWVIAQCNANTTTTMDIFGQNYAGTAGANKTIDFEPYMSKVNPYTGATWASGLSSTVPQSGYNQVNNSLGNISLDSVQVLWEYNKDVFSKVGVTPPTTWSQFVDVCSKLYAAGYQPLGVPGDFNSFYSGQVGWLSQIYDDQTTRAQINIIRAQPGDYCWNPLTDPKWKYDPTDPTNDYQIYVTSNPVRFWAACESGQIKAGSQGQMDEWSNMAQLFPKYAGGTAFFGTSDDTALFYQGKAVMFLNGSWGLAQFKNDMDKIKSGGQILNASSQAITGITPFNLGTFNMPSMQGSSFVSAARSIEVSVGFVGALKKTQAQNDLDADFLMYYSSPTGYSAYIAGLLANGGVPNGMPLVNGVSLPSDYASLFSEIKFIGNCQQGWGQQLARGVADIQSGLRNWYTFTQDYLNGKINITAWGQKANSNVVSLLPQAIQANNISSTDLKNPQNQPTGK
jgi:ABC-type glycerol-3-phosphate transport system substrate-binding protein